MQLERMAVRLRPRNAFEALDLGVALVRANAGRVYGAWLAAYLPATFVVYAMLWGHPYVAAFVLWWLKPLFDRIILAMLSRTLFGEDPSARAILRSPRQWFLGTRLFAALTWGRFDFARSFHLPVHQLERTRGKPGRERVRLLDRDARGAAVWLTVMLFAMEMVLVISGGLALALLVPVQVPVGTILENLFADGGSFEEGRLVGAVLGTLAVSLIEPAYVAAGFTLYLQRRTILEGWDIELRFRHLAERIAAAVPRMAAGLAALFIAGALLIAPATPVHAQTAPPQREAATEIKGVMASSEFGEEKKRSKLRYVGPKWESKDDKPRDYNLRWLQTLIDWISEGTRLVAWVAGGLLLAVALFFIARYVRLRAGARERRERPDFLFGLDVRPESLPADVAAAAAAMARDGRTREALSLLYRGALVRFLDQGLEFVRGDTEGDCQRKVDGAASATLRAFFARLVAAWRSLAYGHRAVGAEAVVALAEEWRRQFEPPSDLEGAR